MDEKNYIDVVDEIITEAYTKGHAEPALEVWRNPNIKHQLDMYGRTDPYGRYRLNHLGVEYALKGCSKGIKEEMDMEKRIKDLEIKTKSFSAEKQELSFWVSIFSAIITTIMAIITFLL